MPIGDPQKAIIVISGFRNSAQQAEQLYPNWYSSLGARMNQGAAGTHPYDALTAQMFNQLPIIEAIARELDASIASDLRGHLQANRNSALVDACDILLGTLQHEKQIEEILAVTGPRLALGEMHAWVHKNVAERWDNGQRRDAVQAAATAVFDIHLPAKLGLPKDTGDEALCAAFKLEDPLPGQPRLRLPGYDRETARDDWTNAHQGAQFLGLACVKAVRNLTTHTVNEPPEEEALEALAMLSQFSRRCHEAVVEKV